MFQIIWAASSEFVSSSIPSWQILTAHGLSLRGARDLAFCLKVPLDSLLVWASSGGSGETARMRRLAWTFAARIGDKYQIRLARPIWYLISPVLMVQKIGDRGRMVWVWCFKASSVLHACIQKIYVCWYKILQCNCGRFPLCIETAKKGCVKYWIRILKMSYL